MTEILDVLEPELIPKVVFDTVQDGGEAPAETAHVPILAVDEGVSRQEERELVQAAQQGDLEAFGQLFSIHAVRMHAQLKRLSPAIADDALQETFLRAAHNIGRFGDRGRGVGGWLSTIALNIGRDMLRNERRRVYTPIESLTTLQGSENTEASAIGAVVLQDVFGQLMPIHRDVLKALYVDGETAEDYAEREGISHLTVRTRVHRARKHLKQLQAEGTLSF